MSNGWCVVNISFDWDGESMWAGPGKPDSPSLVSRGQFAAKVAIPRIRRLLDDNNVRASFFIPGYTAELHADMVKELYRDGHEVAHHNYYHDKMVGRTEEEERSILKQGIEALAGITGENPEGWRCPGWATSPRTMDLLAEYGFTYDSSMLDDEVPYTFRPGSSDRTLAEIPVSWELDDAPYFHFSFFPNYLVGLSSPHKVLDIWKTEFEAAYEDTHYFGLTLHPQIIGRPHRFKVLEEMLTLMKSKDNVTFERCVDTAHMVLAGTRRFAS